MKFKQFCQTTFIAIGLCLSATNAISEELSVATFVPPQHHANTVMFKWFGEELEKRSGGSLTMKLYPAGQLGAGPVQQYKRADEGVADITFGVAAYTPSIFPKTMLGILPGTAVTGDDAVALGLTQIVSENQTNRERTIANLIQANRRC